MDSTGSIRHENFLPLKDWVALSFTMRAHTDEARKRVILRTVGIAKSLIDRLLRGAHSIDDEEMLPIETEDISLENFVVVPTVEGSDPIDPRHILASAKMDKLCIEEMKNIVEKCDHVDFSSPHLRRKGAIKKDALLGHEYFQRLGHLFFQLFVPESDNWRSAHGAAADNSSATDDPSDGENESRTQRSCLYEEEPGSEKGRRKHAFMETCKTFKRVTISSVQDELEQHRLPKPICRFVSNLIESDNVQSNRESFETMNDVSMELSQMIQDPNVYLYSENIKTDELNFKEDLLCGRNEELVELLNAIAVGRMESRSFVNSIVLIGGEPGVGKSHLLRNANRAVTNNGWTSLKAKFDRLSQNQSCSAISSTFDGFIQKIATLRSQIEDGIILDSEEEVLALVSSIENHLNATGIVTLSAVIPSLRMLFPDLFMRVVEDDESDDDKSSSHSSGPRRLSQDSISDESDGEEEQNCLAADTFKHRLHYLFKRLTHAISSPERPMLLVLDDLQWADDASLELISSLVVGSRHMQLMADAEVQDPSCLVIAGTYRSNEMDAEVLLKRYSASETVRVTRINLDGMKVGDTNAMVSYALQLPIRLTRELAAVVQIKTLGNPLFVKEFLNSLMAEKCLYYSIEDLRWQWDIETVKSRSVDDNVAEIMTRKVLQMPKHQQYALSVVSCFGVRVEDIILRLLSSSDQFNELIPSLEEVIPKGMIQKSGTSFIFQHDLIQQAVYDLIDPNDLEQLHYNIGIQLLQVISTLSDHSIGDLRFTAIDQINAATSIDTTDPSLMTSFAQLNLIASQHLIELAKPSLAIMYVRHGLRHLGADGWNSNFQLCLKLHDSGCLASYLNGAPSQVHSFVGETFSNTEELMDRMKSFYVLIRTLGTSGKPEVAVDKSFYVLGLLGENLPDEVSPTDMQAAVFSTKSRLREYSGGQILRSLPKLKDDEKQWTMMMLAVILPYVYTVCPSHLPILSCRMVDISLQYGLSRESAFGFIHLGQILIEFGEIEEAYQWSKVSSSIIQMFKAKSLYPKFKCLVNACVSFWVEPLQSTAMSLSESYEEALLVGDVEYAVLGSVMSFMQHFLCGRVLSDMEKEMDAIVPDMEHLNQLHNIFAHTSMQKAVYALTGSKKDPFSVTQMPLRNEDEVISQFESSRPSLLQMIYFNQIYTEIFSCNFDVVAEICKKYQSIAQQKARFQDVFVVFFQGLAAFHLSRSENDSSYWLSIGEESLVRFRSWLKYSEWNFENKVLLLEAEMHFSKGENDAAEKKYQAAIESARRHRFVHEQGLSNEFLSMFYKSRCEEEMERESMLNAAECYGLWGANGLLAESRFQFFKKNDKCRGKE